MTAPAYRPRVVREPGFRDRPHSSAELRRYLRATLLLEARLTPEFQHLRHSPAGILALVDELVEAVRRECGARGAA